MDSPQNKAGSMDGVKTPHLLPVTLAKKTPRLDVVQRVSAWALINASVFAFSFVVGSAIDHFRILSSQSSALRGDQLADAEEAVANALGIGMLCCVALQATAAVPALCLPYSRRLVRHALAYLALALTIVGHCFFTALGCLLLVADPGDLFFGISFAGGIFIFASGDITRFLDLLLGGEE